MEGKDLPPSPSLLRRERSEWQSKGLTSFFPFFVCRAQVIAGTSEKLIERLSDENRQGESPFINYSTKRKRKKRR